MDGQNFKFTSSLFQILCNIYDFRLTSVVEIKWTIIIIINVSKRWQGCIWNIGIYSCSQKSSIERLDIAQFGSSYVRGVGLPFVDSCKDLGVLVDAELKFHGHIRYIVGRSSGMSVNLLNLTLLLVVIISKICHRDFFNGLKAEVICSESCIYLEFLTRCCSFWNNDKNCFILFSLLLKIFCLIIWW